MSAQTMQWAASPANMDRTDRVELLYARHRDQIYRWALRYAAGDAAFAEDATHDVFVRLLGAIDDLDDPDALDGWLYRVTANRCLSKLRRRQLTRAVLQGLGIAAAEPPRLEARLEARHDLERVLDTLRALPARERMVLTMLHLDGLSQTEIAKTLQLSKGYVSKLVARATEKVRARGWEVSP